MKSAPAQAANRKSTEAIWAFVHLVTQLDQLMSTSNRGIQNSLPKLVSSLLDLGIEVWCRRDVAGYTPALQDVIKLCEVSLTLNKPELVPTILHAAFETGLEASDTTPSTLSSISTLLRTYGHPELLEDSRISLIVQHSIETWVKEIIGAVRPSGTLWENPSPCSKGCFECGRVNKHLGLIRFISQYDAELRMSSFQKGRFRHVQGWLEKLPMARYATWSASVSAPKSITVRPNVQNGAAYVDRMPPSAYNRLS